jgi:hypothetical protein
LKNLTQRKHKALMSKDEIGKKTFANVKTIELEKK